ncbi:peptidyl-prolyl cis-trans isomerase FKBP8-like isoform X2 [Odontomachus brunneus]|nr:peptidyl-prolyl cis-trans isomerase FKBP8-like isoform X2 [Odontomachus brunneus]
MGKDFVESRKTQANFIEKESEDSNTESNIETNSESNIESNTERGKDLKNLIRKEFLNNQLGEWMDILGNGQLKKKVLVTGEEGTRPNRGDTCILRILGRIDTFRVVENLDNFVIQLGDLDVVQGLDLAIALMDVGEIADIEVSPRFAYGEIGLKPQIPPNTVITYTVELKATELETDVETLSIKQRMELGNKKRERGNWWFSRNEPTLAIQCYRRALDFLSPKTNTFWSLDDMETIDDADLQDLLEDRIKVYNNLAVSQMKIQAYEVALESVENVLSFQPRNVKALFRKGKILHYKGEHAQAYTTLLQAAKLEPELRVIQAELAILKEKNAKDALHEKHLYRKMLGTNNTNTSKKITVEEKWQTNRTLWGLVGGASAAVLVGLLAYRFAS